MLAGTFLLAGLSSLALPGLSSFVSEFLVLVGTFTRYPRPRVIATLGIILASLYILLMYQRMLTGPARRVRRRLARHERARGLGGRSAGRRHRRARLLPEAVLDVLNPAIGRTMQQTSVARPGAHRAGRQARRDGRK